MVGREGIQRRRGAGRELVRRTREGERLEEHHRQADVLELDVLARLDAGLDVLLDLLRLGHHGLQRALQPLPALCVEPEGGAGHVRVRAVEAACRVRAPGVLVDLQERGVDFGLLGDRRGMRPLVDRHPRPLAGPVVALGGAADLGLALELDQAEAVERAHVVGHHADVGAQQAGQLERARRALLEHRENAHAQRVAERPHVCGVAERPARVRRLVVHHVRVVTDLDGTGLPLASCSVKYAHRGGWGNMVRGWRATWSREPWERSAPGPFARCSTGATTWSPTTWAEAITGSGWRSPARNSRRSPASRATSPTSPTSSACSTSTTSPA